MKKFMFVITLVIMTTVFCFTSACDIVLPSSHKDEGDIKNTSITNEELTDKDTKGGAPKDKTPATEVYGVIYLNDAYDYGYLTQEDLLSLSYYNQSSDRNKELMGNGFVPKASEMETLDEEIKKEIEAALSETTGMEAFVTDYWGTYNDCVVVWYSNQTMSIPFLSDPHFERIGGVEICVHIFSPSDEMIVAYRLRKDN